MNITGPLANGLYPNIRRVRRPFIIADDDAAPAPHPAPVVAVVANTESTAPAETPKPQDEAGATLKTSRDNETDY